MPLLGAVEPATGLRTIFNKTFSQQLHLKGTPGYYDQLGDCFRTCVANVVGVPPEKIPHFYSLFNDDEDVYNQAILATNLYLQEKYGLELGAYYLIGVDIDHETFQSWQCEWLPDILTITVAAMGDQIHAVLAKNGDIVHDPALHTIVAPSRLYAPWPDSRTPGCKAYASYVIKEMENKNERTWTIPTYISREA